MSQFEPDKILTYKTVTSDEFGPAELNLHVFMPGPQSPVGKRPAIVFFFGGGWNDGTPAQYYPQAEYFAGRGMVAISAEYRVTVRHGSSTRESVKDAKSVIRWLRHHAADFCIDPERIVAAGGSAGGHIAAAAATVKCFEEEGENRSISCRPDALVLFNPVFDNGPGGYGHERVMEYWQDISPMHNIDDATPPTIVFLGTEDHLIPTTTAEKYKQLMNDQGCRCDLHLYEGVEHGFFNFEHYENYKASVIEADRFLASLGFLDGEPSL